MTEIPDRLHTPAEDAIPEGRVRVGRWLVRGASVLLAAVFVLQALHDAGAARVYLAGRHEAPGVDEHVYTGCDALDTLTRALDVLAVK